MVEVTLAEMQQLNIEISEGSYINVEIGEGNISECDYEDYTGSYTVIPSSSEQTLYTAGKHISNNIEIKKIPYAEVSNEAGGNTVIIG